jgi:hypothetical protein
LIFKCKNLQLYIAQDPIGSSAYVHKCTIIDFGFSEYFIGGREAEMSTTAAVNAPVMTLMTARNSR